MKTPTIYQKSVVLLVTSFLSCGAFAVDYTQLPQQEIRYEAQSMIDNVSIPWAMVQLPTGQLLVSDRNGELLLQSSDQQGIRIKGLPKIDVNGQGGLLDLALHPEFESNGWLYFTFSSSEGKGEGSHTALMRAKLDSKKAQLTELQLLYKGEGNSKKGQHYGSRIAFDNQGFVYFSIGDRGARDVNPQDLARDGGKIYRLHDDGRMPTDNPFVSQAGAKKAVWSYGHRNPQGMWFDQTTKQLWAHEHGPKGGDELNLIKPGLNYGWPVVSYGVNYSGTEFTDLTEKQGMENPILQWTPSIAPSDMAYVNSDKYPQLKGKVLLASMKYSFLSALEIAQGKVVSQDKVFQGIGRVRSILQGHDGYIYVGIDGQGVKRLVIQAQ
ncbi:PQQ-dependent sugar dehydrogenase [Pseudoalteromonas ulvae]|uniref:Glucose/Sorbosone dehydrogenase domain-containing protein n=1 Tax=Pseudoalteromonas ulvae TaxID=107327 RepID=A0A244CQI2_PSEDV|nr:PQQ-dependent sugar dehydrogenase [Pseudoalteromonas ulvae]OUL57855.1 hypothetical protein B1199_12435 [Pseudoalteromonas ulvae]